MPKLIKITVILLLSLFSGCTRNWTDKTGATIKADYVSSDGEKVTFRKKGVERPFTVRLSSLSKTDVVFINGAPERESNGLTASGETTLGDDIRFKKLLQAQWQRAEHGFLPYQIFGPRPLKAEEKYPIVLFLHGSGERGMDGGRQIAHSVKAFADKQSFLNNPCIIVAPQCPPDKKWRGEALGSALDLIDHLIANLPVNKDRIYVTGLSMGGAGTWSALSARPEFFAAALIVCGGGNPKSAASFHRVPIRVFHGDSDTVVPVEQSRAMVKSLRDAGGEPIYHELHGVGHNA